MFKGVEHTVGFMPTKPRLITFDTLEQLDVLTSPVRLQLMECFQKPSTVKDVAERLGVPVTRIYYHVNLLVEHGFLAVVEERRVGGLVERHFAVAADGFQPSDAFWERYGAEGRVEAARLLFRTAEAGFEAAARHGLFDGVERATMAASLSQVRMTPERRREFLEKVDALFEEYDDDEGDPMWRLFTFTPRWAP
jgi:predicted ArsR family transcriptional regulator